MEVSLKLNSYQREPKPQEPRPEGEFLWGWRKNLQPKSRLSVKQVMSHAWKKFSLSSVRKSLDQGEKSYILTTKKVYTIYASPYALGHMWEQYTCVIGSNGIICLLKKMAQVVTYGIVLLRAVLWLDRLRWVLACSYIKAVWAKKALPILKWRQTYGFNYLRFRQNYSDVYIKTRWYDWVAQDTEGPWWSSKKFMVCNRYVCLLQISLLLGGIRNDQIIVFSTKEKYWCRLRWIY